MIQGALLAYLLIRLSGIDREVMEKWLYVIVGLTFISGLLGTAHHYYFVGVPSHWLPIGGFFSALEPAVFVAMSVYAYRAMRRSGLPSEHARGALDPRQRAVLRAGRRSPRSRAHVAGGQQVDPRHPDYANARAFGILRCMRHDRLAVITYAMPSLMGHPNQNASRKSGCGRSGCRSAACSA